jgi:hypothetical protein
MTFFETVSLNYFLLVAVSWFCREEIIFEI